MRAAKPTIAALLILSILSACAGPSRHDHYAANNPPAGDAAQSYAEVRAAQAADDHDPETTVRRGSADHRDDGRYARGYRTHYHEEPHPQDQAVAEAALIATGSVFLCTFVVVVLDGACNFGLGFGYSYY